jgi:hypothetical protein
MMERLENWLVVPPEGTKTPYIVGLGVGGEGLCTGRRKGKKETALSFV